ncbi:hypothetical protein AB0L64_17130 [Kribbella sp. NPDC051936]|uniref:hypothetical protein n=1 Tax=Kribbella sp. NPDC051936 TaxID=3154946 RepID=UPI0034190939
MRTVRLGVGVVLAVFFAWLVWRASTDDGFRFIWNRDEGEFIVFVGVVGLASLVLSATSLQPPGFARAGGRWMVRAAAYICGASGLMLVALGAGTAYYNTTDCPTDDGDCLSLLGGMVWSLVSVAVSAVVVVVIEVVLWRHRRKSAAIRDR